MNYSKILTIQDISCVGQCSLTVALPILSACGLETAILPSAVLSTHTAGFKNFTFRDLTDDMPGILAHWESENILFKAIYTGYLGSTKQISYVKDIFEGVLRPDGVKIVDPAMGDNGKLYPLFNEEYAAEMASLCREADIVIPNITEACFLCGYEYRESYDEAYIRGLLAAMAASGMKTLVLTGVSYHPETTGIAVYENGEYRYYEHKKLQRSCHGTGDVYASAFVGAYMQGKSLYDAAALAGDYTVRCMELTGKDANHWYGVKFELALPELIRALEN